MDETLAVVGVGVGEGPAFVGGKVLDEAAFNHVVKGERVQEGRGRVVQDGGGEGISCFATEVDVRGGGEEGGKVSDGFPWGGARVDGDMRGEVEVAEHGVDDCVVPLLVDEEAEVHPVLEAHCPGE